jgi:hypothetical protein
VNPGTPDPNGSAADGPPPAESPVPADGSSTAARSIPVAPPNAADPPAGPVARTRGRARTGIATVAGLSLLGVPFGLLWAALAPGVPVVRTANGVVVSRSQPEEFIAADGWFALLGVAFGVSAAILVWLLCRTRRRPVNLLLVLLGTVGAALLAWQLGRRFGLTDYERLLTEAAVGQHFEKPPDLRAGGFHRYLGFLPLPRGVLLLPAFAAAATYTLLAGWSARPDLRAGPSEAAGPDHPSASLSWDSPAPPDPAAAPAPPEPGPAGPPHG